MRLALIAPWVVVPPIIGGLQIRFHQLQSLLARLAGAQGLAVWDLREGGPVSLEEPPLSDPRRPELAAFVPPHGVRALGLRLRHLWPGYVAPSLADQRRRLLEWLAQQQATHVVLVHPYASELAPILKRRGLHVFIDCHNVESELALQLAELAGSAREAEEARLRHLVFRRRERRCFPAADEVWLPSEEDVCRQQQVCGTGARLRLRVVPNALDLRQYEPPRARAPEATEAGAEAEAEAEEMLDIVYPAEFGYGPNVEAAALLSERILPAVRRRCPRARLVLVGRDRYGLVACLRREPEVVVTDTVPDVRPYLARAAVVPVPLRHGSGTRYKILEALALERAVVTTPRGAEGLALRDGEHGLVRELGDFDEAIVTLLRDRQLARQLGRNGRRLVEERYSWEALVPLLRAALEGSGRTSGQDGAC
ncbi:MAG: glycosyltransferase [Thermogemmatispora sp.]|uniref:glycosyltransferase family 4 protein n=1 Tax=Thermogemmatispora sp. TaxID=1968838 RepID=UPI002612EF14|nr:glycosyltransferase [Thermogemmatispora sp.]MBX5455587.1 glycosyltransferase [Thermogemmatispora sp.]